KAGRTGIMGAFGRTSRERREDPRHSQTAQPSGTRMRRSTQGFSKVIAALPYERAPLRSRLFFGRMYDGAVRPTKRRDRKGARFAVLSSRGPHALGRAAANFDCPRAQTTAEAPVQHPLDQQPERARER